MKQDIKQKNKRGLGRGLSSLIPEDVEQSIIFDEERKDRVQEIEVDKIKANALQPRRTFHQEELDSLCTSIKRNGVIQPIVLRKLDNYYEIIAGERRWRASMQAKLKTVPAIIMDLDEEQRYEVSLVENLQRSDLNPIEEALAYNTLLEKYKMTHEKVSEVVGKSRTYISNSIRLLKLSESVQNDLVNEKITVGHAKMLVTLSEKKQIELSKRIQEASLNVRDVENLLKEKKQKKQKKTNKKESVYHEICMELSEQYGTKVDIQKSRAKGKIVLEFYNDKDFERLYKLIKK